MHKDRNGDLEGAPSSDEKTSAEAPHLTSEGRASNDDTPGSAQTRTHSHDDRSGNGMFMLTELMTDDFYYDEPTYQTRMTQRAAPSST